MKKKLPLGVRFLLGLISFLLCICLFVATVATILVMDLRAIVDKDNLQNMINEILFSPIASQQLPIRGMGIDVTLRQNDIRLADVSQVQTPSVEEGVGMVVDLVYDLIQEQMGDELGVTYEQVASFFEESTAKEFVSDKLSSIIYDCYTGEITTTITPDEIQELIVENKSLLQEHFNLTISEEDLSSAVQWVQESGALDIITEENIENVLGISLDTPAPEGADSITNIIGSISNGEEVDVAAIMAAFRFITSDTALYALIGVCVALSLLLMLVNCTRVYLGFIDSGIAVILAGLIMMIPSAFADMLAELVGGPVGRVVQLFTQATGPVSTTAAGIGLALLVLGIVIYSLRRAKIRKAMRAAAAPVVETIEVPAESAAETPIVEISEEAPVKEVADEAPVEETAEEPPVAQTADEVTPEI